MSNVSRTKYEILKNKAESWRDEAINYKERVKHLIKENEELWDKAQDADCQPNIVEKEIEEENEELKKNIKSLKKKINQRSEEYKHNIFKTELELSRKDNKIEILISKVAELKETCKDLRIDNKELRKDFRTHTG